jgi:hypothetical protein
MRAYDFSMAMAPAALLVPTPDPGTMVDEGGQRPMLRFACFSILSITAISLASACASKSVPDDPRCDKLCIIPPTAAGAVCSPASVDACLSTCDARLEGTGPMCSACRLRLMGFGDGTSLGGECSLVPGVCPGDGFQCTLKGPGGTCVYCDEDQAAQEKCMMQAAPIHQVDCPVFVSPSTECDFLCPGK